MSQTKPRILINDNDSDDNYDGIPRELQKFGNECVVCGTKLSSQSTNLCVYLSVISCCGQYSVHFTLYYCFLVFISFQNADINVTFRQNSITLFSF